MKLMKLFTHQMFIGGGAGYTQDLVISAKDIPGLKVGDIVEIYHPEDEFNRLLIQVGSLKEELQHRDAISLDQTVASTFQLRALHQVCVSIVDPSDVALDLVELTFKDQYVGRSEMWRLGQNLVGTVAYLNKKIEFCQLVRCQVYEMWSRGEKVVGGLITSDTRVVFRSASSMVYLFIQMSSEMWEFDIYGDLYFEKAINGFLSDLFTRWKKEGCNHEVTIVLFSRTYYDALSVECFPLEMRKQVTQDYRGRFYEDYYRVLVHNERLEDWHQVLIQLRKAFNSFQSDVLQLNHSKYGPQRVPRGYNSTASQGNFLEVLNMSLNVFEKHYMDRSLDRTGQLSIVLTPGVGVFEVSRELTSVTKQRIIDCGICSDLVCVGEQPLHAVPLLRFQNRDTLDTDDYNIPHWLNLSFYSSNKKIGYSDFVPRIRVPATPSLNKEAPKLFKSQSARVGCCSESDSLNQLFDYDAHDAQVFTLPTPLQRQTAKKDGRTTSVPPDNKKMKQHSRSVSRFKGYDEYLSTSHAPALFLNKNNLGRSQDSDDLPGLRTVVGSEGSPLERQLAYRPKSRPGRALINPFDPSRVPVKHTSGRRRWVHIYPKQPRTKSLGACRNKAISTDSLHGSRESSYSSQAPCVDEDWSPAVPTGVDWKALTTPACLPITTDYFPDSASLQKDYVVSDYSISPEDVNIDDNMSRRRKSLETALVYKEFVSQRLAQGFQLIIPPPVSKTTMRQSSLVDAKSPSPGSGGPSSTVIRTLSHVEQPIEESLLSIGLIFHRITLRGSTITVTGYKPRHPPLSSKCTYVYNLRTTFMDDYAFSRTEFFTEKLQNYNWNHMDHYICTGGSQDFALTESLKYWRLRLSFIPLSFSKRFCQDPSSPTASEDRVFDGFTKIVENTFNRMKQRAKKPKTHPALERTLTGVSKSERPNRMRAYSVRGKFEKAQFKTEGRNSPSFDLESSSSTDSLPQDRQLGDSPKKVSSDSSLTEIVEVLKGSLSFLEKGEDGLPPMTFVSEEALQCLVEEHLFSKKDAKDVMQRLLSESLICHASGSKSVVQFHCGFHLYYFPKFSSPVKGKDRSSVLLIGDLSLFEQEFIEVDYDKSGNESDISQVICGYRQTDEELVADAVSKYKAELQKLSVFKEANIDVDIASRSDRKEWGHLLYPSYFTPDASYIVVLKWVEATGAIIFDLVVGWIRKAQINGFLLVPMPMDPLFMGDTSRCDPFRAPLPIPMNVQILEKFFERHPAKYSLDRLWLLHDAIARRFGFIPCIFENSRRFQLQYIHSTGMSFLVVPVMPERDSGYSVSKPSVFSMREESPLTVRNFELPSSGLESSLPVLDWGGHKMQCGFLWCSNYLLTKKWRVSQTMDEAGYSKTLIELMSLCSDETRLSDFLNCDK